MTLALLETTGFLWGQSPLIWCALLIFAALGYWYGYVSWFVPQERMDGLAQERKRLQLAVGLLRDQVREEHGDDPSAADREFDPDFADFTVLPGIDAISCAKMHQAGIRNFDQLAELDGLDELELERFRLTFGIAKFRLRDWRWSWDEKSASQPPGESSPRVTDSEPGLVRDEDLGPIYRDEPNSVDRLTMLDGIGRSLARHLNELGIYRFRQIADWNEGNAAFFESRLDLPAGVIEAEDWGGQAKTLAIWCDGLRAEKFVAPDGVDHAKVADRQFAGQAGLRVDKELGLIFDFQPEIVDKLTKIDGIDPKIAAALNELGVYRYRQLANWSQANAGRIASAIEVDRERLEREKWQPQAALLDRETYAPNFPWAHGRPSQSEIEQVIAGSFADEDVVADEDLGIVYPSRPGHADDLSRLDLDAHQQFSLNSVGIWCFRQIAHWPAATVEVIADRLKMSPDGIYQLGWSRKAAAMDCDATNRPKLADLALAARDLLSAGARWDNELGAVFDREPGAIDNLKRIKGVGPKLEHALHEFGIYRFQQIALWTPEVMDKFGEKLPNFRNRMTRDRWQEQAAKLHKAGVGLEPVETAEMARSEEEDDAESPSASA